MDLTSTSSTQSAKSGKTAQKKKASSSGDRSMPKLKAQVPFQRSDHITRSQVMTTPLDLTLPSMPKLKPETGSDQQKSPGTRRTAATTSIVRKAKAKTISFGHQRKSQSGRKAIKKPSPALVPTIESSSGEPGPAVQYPEAEQHGPFPLSDILCGIDNEGAVAGLDIVIGTTNTVEKIGDGDSWSRRRSPLDLTALDNRDSRPLDLTTGTDGNNNDSPGLDYNNNPTPELDALLSEKLDQLNVSSASPTPLLAMLEQDNVEPTPGYDDDADNQDSQMHNANASHDTNEVTTEEDKHNQILTDNEVTDEDEDEEPKKKKPKKIVPAKPRARPVSRSVRAGVTLPVGRVHRQLRRATRCRLSKDAPVFLAGVLEYLVYDIFTLAEEEMRKQKKKRITPKILDAVVRCDAECSEVWKTVTIPECGGGGVSKFITGGQVSAKKKKNAN